MDIYFTPEYGKLYEQHEQARLKQFEFENEDGRVHYIYLLREIPVTLNGQTYYDLITPYGFGGPVIVEAADEDRLLAAFYQEFETFCADNRIVSEFVRFHPIENVKEREAFTGEVQYVGRQIIRDLRQPLTENMSKNVRSNYRRTLKYGLTTTFDTTGERLDDFLEVYYATMDRNGSSDYYYFSPAFFRYLHEALRGHFVYTFVELDGRVLTAGLQLFGETYAYAFLGGTADGAYEYRANSRVEIDTMEWCKNRGLTYYLMGGGHNGEDGIYHFKKKFAKNSDYTYYVGKKIHQPAVYETLVQKRLADGREIRDGAFFPAYRAPLTEKVLSAENIR